MFGKTLIVFGKLEIKILRHFSILIYGLSKINKSRIINAKPFLSDLRKKVWSLGNGIQFLYINYGLVPDKLVTRKLIKVED